MFLTPELVREVSAFYETRGGANPGRITISFEFPQVMGPQLASFDPRTAILRIFIPQANGQMLITGTNPKAIVHEIGHAFHEMVEHRYGRERLMRDFTAFNQRYIYSPLYDDNPDPTVFATHYATTNYNEDFAESFAMLFTANRPGLSITDQLFFSGGRRTSLGDKMAFIERLVEQYITDNATATANAKRIYNTQRYLTFAGVNWRGNSLMYIGFNEPNGVFAAIEEHLGVTTKASRWIPELGGWYIECISGARFYAFPGGASKRAS
jgi:hypothetical protein